MSAKFADAQFELRTHEYTSLVDAVARNVDERIADLRRQRDERVGQ